MGAASPHYAFISHGSLIVFFLIPQRDVPAPKERARGGHKCFPRTQLFWGQDTTSRALVSRGAAAASFYLSPPPSRPSLGMPSDLRPCVQLPPHIQTHWHPSNTPAPPRIPPSPSMLPAGPALIPLGLPLGRRRRGHLTPWQVPMASAWVWACVWPSGPSDDIHLPGCGERQPGSSPPPVPCPAANQFGKCLRAAGG